MQLNWQSTKVIRELILPTAPKTDLFLFHRTALRPLLGKLNEEENAALFNTLRSFDLNIFFAFLHRQGLSQLWFEFLTSQEVLPGAYEQTVKDLKRDSLSIAANQLMQQKVMGDVSDAFFAVGIEYLVFKGAHLRHTLYANPTLRPASDVDILVRDQQKLEAVEVLLRAGFTAHHKVKNISHETSLYKNNICIDLHWHIMRPGRTRIDPSDYLFSQRQVFGKFQGLSNEASLLVMLVHPAITKYVNSDASILVHLVDSYRLAQCNDINWGRLTDTLITSGTRTAAWASLVWLQMLADKPVHEDLADQLSPGSLKARWLRFWLRKNLNKKLAGRKFIIRTCFSLVLQDSIKDVFIAVRTLRKEKQKIAGVLTALELLE